MPFKESQRVVYRKNTLEEVICQLRFPTILRIGTDQPADFQERVRYEYPLYSLQEPSIELPVQLPKEIFTIIEQVGFPKPAGAAVHRFSTTDGKRFIALSQGFLALTESAYVKWELFRAEMEKAERALQEVYSPSFYQRIGLRYRNVISRDALGLTEVRWKELLQPHIVGELADRDIEDAVVASQTRSVIAIPEVPGGQVKLTHGLLRQSQTNEDCYVIDADLSVERKEGLDETFAILDKFNRLAGRLIRWAITERLHNAMDPVAI